MNAASTSVAGVLLTGGSSRRMGRDKAMIVVDGTPIATRLASLLTTVVSRAIEVGPGFSGLSWISEEPRGQGPLVAIEAGYRALSQDDIVDHVLVVACDLPRVSDTLLRWLVHYDAPGSVVPLVEGRAQPLCARWCRADLDELRERIERGERSLRHLVTQPNVTVLDETQWRHVAHASQFFDLDCPDDLRLLNND